MSFRRVTFLVADGASGAERRFTIGARPAIAVACAVVTLPVLAGVGTAWKARRDVAHVYASEQSLRTENASYRSATAELTGQIEALQAAIADLGSRRWTPGSRRR